MNPRSKESTKKELLKPNKKIKKWTGGLFTSSLWLH